MMRFCSCFYTEMAIVKESLRGRSMENVSRHDYLLFHDIILYCSTL